MSLRGSRASLVSRARQHKAELRGDRDPFFCCCINIMQQLTGLCGYDTAMNKTSLTLLLIVAMFVCAVSISAQSTDTPIPTITLTPTPTNTPTPPPFVYATIAPESTATVEGQMTRFDYTVSVGETHIGNMLAWILYSAWGMFLFTLLVLWWRSKK